MFIRNIQSLKDSQSYVIYRSYVECKMCKAWSKLSELDERKLNNFLKHKDNYYEVDSKLLEDRIRMGANIDLIEDEFGVPYEALNHFCKWLYKEKIDDLLTKSYAQFKVQLFKDAYSLAKRNPMIMKMFMERYLDFKSEESNSNEQSINQQLLTLLNKGE